MKPHRSLVWYAAALPLLFVLACGDPSTPTATPEGLEPARALSLSSLMTLQRTVEVKKGLCARKVSVGPEGGSVECEDAGLRLDFPEGALSETIEVSVKIPRGDLVGYEFEPHGTDFEKKVRLRQSLAGTEAEERGSLLGDLVGAYVDEIDDVVNPLELFPAGLAGSSDEEDDPEALFFKIEHFSGYVCASN